MQGLVVESLSKYILKYTEMQKSSEFLREFLAAEKLLVQAVAEQRWSHPGAGCGGCRHRVGVSLAVVEGSSPDTCRGCCPSLWGTGKMSWELPVAHGWWEAVGAKLRRRKVALRPGSAMRLVFQGSIGIKHSLSLV